METMAEQGPEPDLAAALLAWYDGNGRAMPWRLRGARQEPYYVWLSEIMLQQTTVAAVRDYFVKFITRWSTVQDLAAADRDDVLRAWAGLGYYARARNLHACAQVIVQSHDGRFPASIEVLQKLPGIGPYTAGAIAAIAFDQPHAAVDGNVERVLSRLHAIKTPLPDSKPLIRKFAQDLVPQARPGDFAQALMDLGATLCTPKNPACAVCPWANHCKANAAGIAETLPRRQPKKPLPARKGHAFHVTRADGAVLLRRRPDKGLLGGMMEVPGTTWEEALPQVPDVNAPIKAKWKQHAGVVEHTFTHFHLQVTVLSAIVKDAKLPDQSYLWVSADNLKHEALPTVMRKILAHAAKGKGGKTD